MYERPLTCEPVIMNVRIKLLFYHPMISIVLAV